MHARRAAAPFAALALSVGLLVALTVPASAGENLHGEVNKVVVGTAPAGTTFTIHWSCTVSNLSGDLTFDAAGNPTPPNSNFFNSLAVGSTCTIAETGTGGASSVTYQCQSDGVNSTCGPGGDSATFVTTTSNNVVFTVTNTFPATAITAAAEPTFTG